VEAIVKYLILIYGNQVDWDGFSAADKHAFGRDHLALTDSLAESGELVLSEGLADPELATCVSVRDGQTVTTDGPYAEAKEHLAGLYLVECDSIERAIEQAARMPDARYGAQVEVRPVLDFSGWEM
jgi:hypothetical protein